VKENKIFIISAFSGPLDGGFSNRFVYIANLLGQKYNVELLTTDFYHSKKEKISKPFDYQNFDLKQFRVPVYKTNISIKRLWSHFIFALKIFLHLRGETDEKSIVYCCFPPIYLALFSFLGAKNKSNFILDVQDLWPEVFYASKSNQKLEPFFFIHRALVKWLAARTENLVSVSNTYLEHFKNVGFKGKREEVVYIGVDVSGHIKTSSNWQSSKSKNDEIRYIYAGTLGHSYNLDHFLKCFKKAQLHEQTSKKLKLILIGTGPLEDKLKGISKELEMDIEFTGRISHQKVIEKLKVADVAINSMAPNMQQSIINKHGDYTLTGLPIISTQDNLEFKSLINQYGFGVNVDPENEKELIKEIIDIAHDDLKRSQMAEKSMLVGNKLFNRHESYQRIEDLIQSLIVQDN